MRIYYVVFGLAASALLRGANSSGACQPSTEIRAELENAAALSAAVTAPFAAMDRAAPFLAVRDRHPDALFTHERYQDGMTENGIEGHLRLLTKQYQELESAHPNDPMYRYLYLRTLVGRSTTVAIAGLVELLAEDPAFAPAHRTLAEIYGVEAFRDLRKQQSEKGKYLALCPGGVFTRRPTPIPEPSPLIDRAERLLTGNVDSDRVIAMTIQGLQEFEWRSQRIRAFDWYSSEYKLQDARELRAKYWKAWPIQVRCYRKAGRTAEANQLLAYMEQRAKPLRNLPGTAYWDAVDILALLYAEGKQTGQATRKLGELQQLLTESKDPAQRARLTTRLDHLREIIARPELTPN